MEYIACIHSFAFAVQVCCAVYVLGKKPQSRINRSVFFVLVCFSIWNLQNMFIQSPRLPIEWARLIMNMGSIGWIGFYSFLIWNMLLYGGRKELLRKRMFYVVNFGVPCILVLFQFAGFGIKDYVKTAYGWSYIWPVSVWGYLYVGYCVAVLCFVLVSLVKMWRVKEKKRQQAQMRIFFIGGIIPVVLGSFTDIVVRSMGTKFAAIPALADVFVLTWTFSLVYCIVRYKSLSTHFTLVADDIIANLTDAMILLDKKGRIVEMNDPAENLTGFKTREVRGEEAGKLVSGKSFLKMGLDKEELIDVFKEASRQATPVEVTLMSKEGKALPILLSVNVIKGEEGESEGVVLFARGIGERVNAERALAELNEQLQKNEKALMNILSDLKRSHEELEGSKDKLVQSEKLASLGSLVSDMAHEVNNPLMVISGRAQLALMDVGEDKELEENLKAIVDQCLRAKDIIQRLLSFSKPSRGELKKDDINTVVEFVVKLLEHQLSLSNINFVKKYGANLPLVEIDEKQVHEVFMNLIKNASEAIKEGGTITIKTEVEDGKVGIKISDTGEGISKENLKKIFDPFFTTKEEGTGLGLSVCYGIVQSHGGDMIYESTIGKGTTAKVWFPYSKE